MMMLRKRTTTVGTVTTVTKVKRESRIKRSTPNQQQSIAIA